MSDQVMTFPYDRQHYSPPAPVVQIEISAPGRPHARHVAMALLDSGADGTLVPIDMLEATGARAVGDAIMVGVSGERQAVQVYVLNISVGPHTISAVRVVAAVGSAEIILGRDVLNQLTITLIGPALALEVAE